MKIQRDSFEENYWCAEFKYFLPNLDSWGAWGEKWLERITLALIYISVSVSLTWFASYCEFPINQIFCYLRGERSSLKSNWLLLKSIICLYNETQAKSFFMEGDPKNQGLTGSNTQMKETHNPCQSRLQGKDPPKTSWKLWLN